MRKEDIEISLHDGTLTISGERKHESNNGETAQRTSVSSANSAAASPCRRESIPARSMPPTRMEF